MIEIKVTRDGKEITTSVEMDIHGKRKDVIAEFIGVMNGLKQSDKEIFRDALHHIVNEDIHEMIDELDELEDGGELDD